MGRSFQIIPSVVIEEMDFLKNNGLFCMTESWESVGFCPNVKSLLSVSDSVCLASQLVSGIWLLPQSWDHRPSATCPALLWFWDSYSSPQACTART